MNKFGELIREKREEKEMLLRHLSAELDIDVAQLSKIERGEKTAKREYLEQLANILDLYIHLLTALWLADQVYSLVEDEKSATDALDLTISEIKANRKHKF